ncbi:glycosyltransferase, partial [Rosenbergiella collisarenosi]|uniref:glycosyltransferase n=1 Tax=Rosenbergiella collisarenosi TaxID=1544695 RepID=UPI001F4DFAB3
MQSIKTQSLLPREVVIIFDGEVPKKLEYVINEYTDLLNIKVFKLEENVGLGLALRFGLEKCSSELIARMDTDDICLEDRFIKQISYLVRNPEIDILGSSIIEFDESNGSQREKLLPVMNADIKKFSLMKNPINHRTVVFRKAKIRAFG